MIAIRQGSLVVFFGALVSALGFFSSYSDFFESIALIKKHTRVLLRQELADRFGGDYDVAIEVEFPRFPDPDEFSSWRRARKILGPEFHDVMGASAWSGLGASLSTRRDGFFWFLLASTILLLVLLGFLVAGAVQKTYFPEPPAQAMSPAAISSRATPCPGEAPTNPTGPATSPAQGE